MLDPFRSRFSFEIMIEILLHSDGIIQLIGIFLRVMRLAAVLQENAVLTQAAHSHIKLNPLVPRNSRILVAEHDQHGCLDAVRKKQRRIFNVQLWIFPEAPSNPALRLFVLELPGQARSPPYAPIGTGHIGDGSARDTARENVRLGNDKGGLISAPGMTVQADGL